MNLKYNHELYHLSYYTENYTLSDRQIKILQKILFFLVYLHEFADDLKVVMSEKETSVLVINDPMILTKILDYNLNYLLRVKKTDSFYILELPTDEMIQLKLSM